MINATVIGIPLDLGAENLGVDIGPNAFRYQGLGEKLQKSGFHITDAGNIACAQRNLLSPGNPQLKYLDEIVRVSEKSAQLTHDLIRKNEKVIVLGGDHSVCLGVVSGASVALNNNLGIIYLDAHGDMNTDKTSSTGNIHGMHLASLMGYGDQRLATIMNPSIKIDKKNMLHIGGYDLDDAEIELIEKEGLNTYRIFNVLSNGLGPLFQKIEDLGKTVENIWVSLDLDVIDSTYAPGAGMPNRAGLTYREITTIMSVIGKSCNVVGIDVVEYNPLQDVEAKTAELGIELIAKLFGRNYSWYTNYLQKNKVK